MNGKNLSLTAEPFFSTRVVEDFSHFSHVFMSCFYSSHTPSKTEMEPEHHPFQKEIRLNQTFVFWGVWVSSGYRFLGFR